MKKVKAVLIEAGNRGITYTDIMSRMPENYEVVAVAEPIESRREYIRKSILSAGMLFLRFSV